jgi:hypothetical protein
MFADSTRAMAVYGVNTEIPLSFFTRPGGQWVESGWCEALGGTGTWRFLHKGPGAAAQQQASKRLRWHRVAESHEHCRTAGYATVFWITHSPPIPIIIILARPRLSFTRRTTTRCSRNLQSPAADRQPYRELPPPPPPPPPSTLAQGGCS